jgi:hypothetical protein
MMLGVMFGGLVRVMRGMQAMGMRDVGVMAGLLMLAALVVLGRLAVMVRRALMVLGGGLVVLAAVVSFRGHWFILLLVICKARLIQLSDTRLTPA